MQCRIGGLAVALSVNKGIEVRMTDMNMGSVSSNWGYQAIEGRMSSSHSIVGSSTQGISASLCLKFVTACFHGGSFQFCNLINTAEDRKTKFNTTSASARW